MTKRFGKSGFTLAEGATHVVMSDNIRRYAFTLAEVLITLAIIGVVAVLTVPTLITNNQEKGWNTASKVFEAKLEQALKVMNTQGTLAGYRTTKDFVDELSNHLKIVKICDSDKLTDCFEDKINWEVINISRPEQKVEIIDVANVKTAADLGQDDWNTEVLGFQLNNGTSGLIAYNPDCKQDQFSNQITGTSCVAVVYDTSGFSKPNTYTKDVRSINSMLGSCAFKSDSTCYGAPFIPTPMSYAECAGENATSTGTTTRIPGAEASKLGIGECYVENDYWAGAVKVCGGTNKIPTMAQLAEIVNYIYNTDKVQANNTVGNLTRNESRVSSLGFTLNSSNSFYVWSSDMFRNHYEYGRNDAYIRFFYSTSTSSSYSSKDNRSIHAVCIQ